jgi:hypothetical protein
MLPLLPFHALATRRGDGLRPELLALFKRYASSPAGLSAGIEPDDTEAPRVFPVDVPKASADNDVPNGR